MRHFRERMTRLAIFWGLAMSCMDRVTAVPAAEREVLPTLSQKTEGLEERSGLLDFFVDRDRGTVWLSLPAPDATGRIGRYLYFEGLVTGLGSNPVGLDRSQVGETRLIELREVGGRVLLEQINTRYRALSDNLVERRATEQSFATSVLWGNEIAARDPDGTVLVDFTSFLLRDAHGVAATLKSSEQGSFSLDAVRSAVDLEACLAFPENLEFEVLLTFKSDSPGREVRATAPAPEAISLTLHHSILRLPDSDYTPRRFDPRVGCYALTFADYAAGLDEPLEKRWIMRHRLHKIDPAATRSRVKKPIVYYVDRGAPEPVRSALLEGARWWAEAFEAAGFIDAFRVELLPEDVHPLDARYNVISWVHRATRGWSYGWGVVDPRTGEFIKGHVLLGSLRVRQDRLLFEGLAGTAHTGTGRPDDPIQLSLARIRQLAAHEVGHTLGIAHNFAASTYGRESVMDYPAPLVKITETGAFDFSEVYGVGVGAWDIQAIRYGYSEFPSGADEAAELEMIVQDGSRRGLHFITDADARPSGAAHPDANLWDNGERAEDGLAHVLKVRQLALQRFGADNIAKGQPLALLDEVLVPVYFMHRYAVDAAAKVLGGVYYSYAVRGDAQPTLRWVAAERQQRALDVLLQSVRAEDLDVPEAVQQLLLPRPFGYGRSREQFASATLPTFDALGAAATAARLVARSLLQHERAARLIDQHRREASLPSLEDVLTRIRDEVFDAPAAKDARRAEIQRVVQRAFLESWLQAAADPDVPARVRARLDWMLEEMREEWLQSRPRESAWRAHQALLAADVKRHLDRLTADAPESIAEPPPGSPIGVQLPPPLASCSWGPLDGAGGELQIQTGRILPR